MQQGRPSSSEMPDEIKATSSPRLTTSFIEIIKKDPFYPKMEDLFLWKDVTRSALVFGIMNFTYFLLAWGEYTVLTLSCYVLLALLVICLGYSVWNSLSSSFVSQGERRSSGNPFIARFGDDPTHISKEAIESHLSTITDLINLTLSVLRETFFCTNLRYSMKFAGILYLLAWIGTFFKGETLIYLVLFVLFVWPRLYSEKKEKIDELYAVAVQQITIVYQQLLTKMPPVITGWINRLSEETKQKRS